MRVAVSIHAPREGRDLCDSAKTADMNRFQSTRPVKGATWMRPSSVFWRTLFQSTRPVKGATPGRHLAGALRDVSIHAPREGRDP